MENPVQNLTFDYAQIGGVKLHYAASGEGEKLVLLLHGFPEFWYSWRHQINALSDRYTVVAPDLRGYNLSDKPENVADYEVDKLVDDITGLIRFFGRSEAAIVGHDWGAAIAWALVAKHPEYVSKLCAMQVPPLAVWRKNQTFRQFLASWYMFFFQIPVLPEWILSRNDFALLEQSLKRSNDGREAFSEKDIAEYKKSWSEPDALTAALNYYRANIFQRLFAGEASNEKIKVPTLFIYGEKDEAVLPETVQGVGEFVDAPFAEMRIPDGGHWVLQESPEVVSDALLEFLAE